MQKIKLILSALGAILIALLVTLRTGIKRGARAATDKMKAENHEATTYFDKKVSDAIKHATDSDDGSMQHDPFNRDNR